jgi:hypothetical protein
MADFVTSRRLPAPVSRRGAVAFAVALAFALAAGPLAPSAEAACTRFAPRYVVFENGALEVTRPFRQGARVTGIVNCEDGTVAARSGTVVMAEVIGLSFGLLVPFSSQIHQLQPGNAGIFLFDVPPGPTRRLYLGYIHPTGAYSTVNPNYLVVNVRTRPILKVKPKVRRVGRRVRFSGSLPGPFYGGRPVIAMQARSGRRWRSFKVASIAADGSFQFRYRFTRTTKPTVYRFRAKPVESGTDYPYLARPSKVKKVRVKP